MIKERFGGPLSPLVTLLRVRSGASPSSARVLTLASDRSSTRTKKQGEDVTTEGVKHVILESFVAPEDGAQAALLYTHGEG